LSVSNSKPFSPFRKIAIGLSGGGYRASAFHLGTLDYLNHIQYNGESILSHVETISTVSGGSITGVVFALHQAQGKSFAHTFSELHTTLSEVDLVAEALQKIDHKVDWKNPNKRKNLINAFSELYDQYFTKGATFSIFNQLREKNATLKEVIFNATEFNHGIGFRFQSQGIFGNAKLRIAKTIASEIKLSDIIAASSCFPGAFEPIGFPEDFVHSEAKNIKEYQQQKKETIALMDGGIYDNQGIESLLLSDSRGDRNQAYYDLIIISDVSSPNIDQFEFAQKKTDNKPQTSLKEIILLNKKKLSFIPITLTLIIVVGALLSYFSMYQNSWLTGFSLSLLLFSIMLLLFYYAINEKVASLLNVVKSKSLGFLPNFIKDRVLSWNIFNYKVERIEKLFLDRKNSIEILIGSVFLKQIRRLQYNKLYTDEKYKYRRVSNLIHTLTSNDFKEKKNRNTRVSKYSYCPDQLKGEYQSVVKPALRNVTEKAAQFGTTLWFTEKQEIPNTLNHLIISGQATVCFNLMIYIIELLEFSDDTLQTHNLEKTLEQCLQDWMLINQNPDFFLEKKSTKI